MDKPKRIHQKSMSLRKAILLRTISIKVILLIMVEQFMSLLTQRVLLLVKRMLKIA